MLKTALEIRDSTLKMKITGTLWKPPIGCLCQLRFDWKQGKCIFVTDQTHIHEGCF